MRTHSPTHKHVNWYQIKPTQCLFELFYPDILGCGKASQLPQQERPMRKAMAVSGSNRDPARFLRSPSFALQGCCRPWPSALSSAIWHALLKDKKEYVWWHGWDKDMRSPFPSHLTGYMRYHQTPCPWNPVPGCPTLDGLWV